MRSLLRTIIIFFIPLIFCFYFSVTEVFAGCWTSGTVCVHWTGCTKEEECDECYYLGYQSFTKEYLYCVISSCGDGVSLGECRGDTYRCTEDSVPGGCPGSGGCFSSETEVSTPDGEREIQDIQLGDDIASYNPETDEASTSTVEKVYELEREGYYKIKTKSGEEVKVTAEHPLYAVQKDSSDESTASQETTSDSKPTNFWEYLKTESLIKNLIDTISNSISKF